MSSQYGELQPTNGWDRFGSLRYPANFNGFHVLAALLNGTIVMGISQTLRIEQRARPIFGRGAMMLGNGPHFYFVLYFETFKFWRCWNGLAQSAHSNVYRRRRVIAADVQRRRSFLSVHSRCRGCRGRGSAWTDSLCWTSIARWVRNCRDRLYVYGPSDALPLCSRPLSTKSRSFTINDNRPIFTT